MCAARDFPKVMREIAEGRLLHDVPDEDQPRLEDEPRRPGPGARQVSYRGRVRGRQIGTLAAVARSTISSGPSPNTITPSGAARIISAFRSDLADSPPPWLFANVSSFFVLFSV